MRRLTRLLVTALGSRAAVDVQSSFPLSDDSEPEPDVVVLPWGDDATPTPQAALLLIEVAESSLRRDRGIKARLYAAAGIREYWIVNLAEGVIEVSRGPSADGYSSSTRHARGDALAVPGFPEVVLAVDDVLPPRRT